MTKEYRITYNDVVLHGTRQPSGRMTLSYKGDDTHVIDFVNRINREESTFADVASELDAIYGVPNVQWELL